MEEVNTNLFVCVGMCVCVRALGVLLQHLKKYGNLNGDLAQCLSSQCRDI